MNLFKNRFIAHRGLHKSRIIPENSIQAFKNAMEKNYAIEFDINITIDKTSSDLLLLVLLRKKIITILKDHPVISENDRSSRLLRIAQIYKDMVSEKQIK